MRGVAGIAIPPIVLPVIHYADDNQAMRNAERAIDAGCAGVMLIEMGGRNAGLSFIASAIKRRWPDRHVGVNRLAEGAWSALAANCDAGLDSTWTDDQLTHSGGALTMEASRTARLLESAAPHQMFCAVAFKYQPHEPDPADAAARAVALGFIPTTSGPSTGVAPDLVRFERMRALIGPRSLLAIASGITPENAAVFAPHVSHILVSTGVSASFHEFDPVRLRSLVQATQVSA